MLRITGYSDKYQAFPGEEIKFYVNAEKNENYDVQIVRLIHGDIRNYKRCMEVSKNIDIVIHAAAMKHVPITEYNPFFVAPSSYAISL